MSTLPASEDRRASPEPFLPGSDDDRKRWIFALALLLGTWIPMACLIAVGWSDAPGVGLETAKAALVFVNSLHVAATIWLYVDRRFLRVMAQHRARYVYAPLAVVLASGTVFTLAGPEVQAYWMLVYWAWQAYHYGRQNVGIYSFASIAEGRCAERAARWPLELATACAICGTFQILGAEVSPGYLRALFENLYRVGAVAFAGVVVLGAFTYLRRIRESSPLQAAFFFTLLLFFAPIFLSTNPIVAFSSYAVAHGIQYMVIVSVLAGSLVVKDGRRGVSGRMTILLGGMILLGVAAYLKAAGWGESTLLLRGALDFAAGMVLGTAAAHFIVDAGAWRLSEPPIRAYMASRFGFLLGPARPGPRA